MTSGAGWGDALAIAIQRSHMQGRVNGNQPLVRIDAQREAAQAPYQFDPVRGRLHRSGCRAIPPDARSALFGRWAMAETESTLACADCAPTPNETSSGTERIKTVELLYGVASILGQFGTLLYERGKEFRSSDEGRQLEQQVDKFYAQLSTQQQQVFNLLLTSLEQLVTAVQDCDRKLQGANGVAVDPPPATRGKRPRREAQSPKAEAPRPRRQAGRRGKAGEPVKAPRRKRSRS